MDQQMATAPDNKAEIQEQIRIQGDVVRRLKKEKKPEEEVRVLHTSENYKKIVMS